MALVDQVKEILVSLFEKTAKEKNVNVIDVKLYFMLKSIKEFKCLYDNKEEVSVSKVSITAMMASGVINSTIVKALLKFSDEYQIEKSKVNVVMELEEGNNIVLYLMDGYILVRSVKIVEILK